MGLEREQAKVECIAKLLSFIISANYRPISVVCSPEHRRLQRFLYLQALTYESSTAELEGKLPLEEIVANCRPMAIVDVSERSVREESGVVNGVRITKEKVGPLVNLLVDRIVQFRRTPGMLTRLCSFSIRDIEGRADLFVSVFNNRHKQVRAFDWDDRDLEIVKAWACKVSQKVKRGLSRSTPSTPDPKAFTELQTILR